ncbi:MAG: hypothetical protein A3C51_05315 [Omnitrophica bacterium RIFCSPHIGHO2_02_FULL_46_20]|nr:MAG: hypothetical protein A3C51_05315 [Omnitrophica bacterium RIFCSPHIGHO2_02_FULL_46_20]
MKSRLLMSVLVVSFFVIASISIVYAYTELSATSAIRGEGQVPFMPQPLLDDFRNAAPVNIWGTLTGIFSSSPAIPPPANAICAASYTNNTAIAYGGAGYSLQLDYNVSAANSHAGYYSLLGSASLTGYNAVSFYVRGAVGGEFFKISLKNASGTQYLDGSVHYYRNEASLYITDYLDGGVTTTWKKVTIPFHNFTNLDGWNAMKEFVIVFESAQSAANSSLSQGAVYIDNIQFENIPAATPVRIDHFGDRLGVSALGGNIGSGGGNGGTASYDFAGEAGNYSPYPYSIRINYNVNTSSAYAYAFFIFGGGNNAIEDPGKSGWIATPHDFGDYNYISLQVKGRSGTENPKTIKIELADSVKTTAVVLAGITANWQSYKIPLSTFINLNTNAILDKRSVKQMTLVLEDWRISGAGGNKAGAVLVDSVQFE